MTAVIETFTEAEARKKKCPVFSAPGFPLCQGSECMMWVWDSSVVRGHCTFNRGLNLDHRSRYRESPSSGGMNINKGGDR